MENLVPVCVKMKMIQLELASGLMTTLLKIVLVKVIQN